MKKAPSEVAVQIERCLYMRVAAVSAEAAMKFAGIASPPVDLGVADPKRYIPGCRVWGFTYRSETAEEKAHRIWTVANGGTVSEL